MTVLHTAVEHSHIEVATLLLDRGASLEAVTGERPLMDAGCTPLHIAAMEEFVDGLTLLLDRGANAVAVTKVPSHVNVSSCCPISYYGCRREILPCIWRM